MKISLEVLVGISLKENQEKTKRENWLELNVGQKKIPHAKALGFDANY